MKNETMNRLDEVKVIVKSLIPLADCGIFNTRNLVGDHMETVYRKNGVTIDVCMYYSYLEVFGLTCDEFDELKAYYNQVEKSFKKRRRE